MTYPSPILIFRQTLFRSERLLTDSVSKSMNMPENTGIAEPRGPDLYHQMFIGHSAPMLLIDPSSGTIMAANPAACRFYGYSPNAIRQLRISQINTLPADEVHRRMAAAREKSKNFFIFEHRLASGEIRDVEVHSVPIQIEGRVLLYSIIHDITERRRAEKILEENEEKYRELFNRVADAIFIYDPVSFEILDANEATARIYGYEKEELRGMSCLKFSAEIKNSRETSEKIVRDGEAAVRYRHHKKKDGTDLFVHLRGYKTRVRDRDMMFVVCEDHTERKRMEDELRESENKFRSIAENAVDSIFIKDERRRYTFANQAMQRLLGLPAEKIIGQSPSDIFGAEQGETVREIDDRTFSGEIVNETRSLDIRGRKFFFNTIQTPLIVEGGRITSIMGIVRDVTNQQMIEEALRDSENKYRQLINSDVFICTIIDEQGTIWMANKLGARLMGETPESIVGKTFFSLRPDRVDLYRQIQEKLPGLDRTFSFETRLPIGDSERWLFVTVSPLKFGNQDRYQIITFDITERKLTEEALRESEERYRRLTDNARDLIYRMSLPDGNYEYVSPAAVDIFGYDPEEFYASPSLISNIIHPDWRGYFEEQFKNLLSGRMPPFYEYQIIHKNGMVRWMHQRNALVRNEEGNPIAIEGIVTDITDRKESEEFLKRSLTEKELLLREIHHRVKNNMQVISSLLTSASIRSHNPEFDSLVQKTNNRIQAMARIHEQLYESQDFSRIAMDEYINRLADLVADSLTTAEVRIRTEAKGVLLPIDQAIPCGLILNELLSNSFKHAFSGNRQGTIDIRLVTLGNEYLLEYSDNGIPIPRDFDWKNAPTMGLRMINMLVSQLEGDIRQLSTDGNGFIIRFPHNDR